MKQQVRLIFVDDEPLVLQGLRRSLHSMTAEWQMEFVPSASAALERMETAGFDAVVTDMRMPGMNGAQLLKEVKSRYPEMIRIVLSGQSSRSALFEFIDPSHQYVSKPCDIGELKNRILRAFALRDLMANQSLKGMISQVSSIPSLPALYTKIMDEVQSPDGSIARIASIIANDPGMTAKILQIANSALLSLRTQISQIQQAVSLIGMEMIRALVLSVPIFSQFDITQLAELDIPQLWRHSLVTGTLAKAISQSEHASKAIVDESFTAGLLHDSGKLLLAAIMPEQYKQLLKRVVVESLPLPQAESETFGCSHQEVGAYLMAIWGLPPGIVEAAAWHHCPSAAASHTYSALTAVHIADTLLNETDFAHLGAEKVLDHEHLSVLGVSERAPAWQKICDETLTKSKFFELTI